MMFKGVTGCKQKTETGFISVNGVNFGSGNKACRKKITPSDNRLANVCLDC